jgi:hypothetical protein
VERPDVKRDAKHRPASAPVKNEERVHTQNKAWEEFKPTVPKKEIKARDFTKSDDHEWQVRKLCREKTDGDYRTTLVEERKKEERIKNENYEQRRATSARQRPASAMDAPRRNSGARPASPKSRPASAPRAQKTGNQSTGRCDGEEIIYESAKSMGRQVQSARQHRPEQTESDRPGQRRAWSASATRQEVGDRRERDGGGRTNGKAAGRGKDGKENKRRPGTAKKVTDPFHPEVMTKQFEKQAARRNKCIRGYTRGASEYACGGLQDVPEEQMSELDAFEERYRENMAAPNEQRSVHWREVDSGTRKIRPDGTIDWS